MNSLLKYIHKIPFFYNGVARKLITRTILFSSVITLFITAFNIYDRYQYELGLIGSKFIEINDVHLGSLTNNLWLADKKETQVQLNGILRIPEIQYLEIYENSTLWASAGTKSNDNILMHTYPMTYTYKGKSLNIGELKVFASLDTAYRHMYQELWLTLATNAIKTFLVAFFMLIIFYDLVVRHLQKLATHLNSFDINDHSQTLSLDRKAGNPGSSDEFDLVVSAFNELQRNLQQAFNSVEKQVKERTEELSIAKDEAERANKTKSEFLSRMSHELRTPMNAILGFGQLLQAEDCPARDHKDFVEEIMRAGYHLLALINDLLDLAKIEEGKFDIRIEKTDVTAILNEAIHLLVPQAKVAKVNITNNAPKDVSYFSMADGLRLKQVIINILSNAIKYNSVEGEVVIDVCSHKDLLQISISDTGPGIAFENLDKLFTPFERLSNALNNAVEGTGIGLALSKRLMKLMHGDITVDSRPGHGCTFTIELPFACQENTTPTTSSTITSSEYTHPGTEKTYTVLYVEDNPPNLRLVSHALEYRNDIHLIAAHTGKLGLELAIGHLPDLILLDINLPGLDGMEILQQLRQIKQTANIPVIAITANAMPRDIEAGRQAGFNDYLIKPLDIKRFHALLKQYIP